jgi:DNA-binding transcriptional ArsR family regulator
LDIFCSWFKVGFFQSPFLFHTRKELFSKFFFTKNLFLRVFTLFTGARMSKFEEETYSIIFAALKHPIRRKILRLLSEGPRSFTEMQNLSNVNSPYLTYHLESLEDLISKTENGRYRLSNMGEGAVALMEKVEETPKATPKYPLSSRRRRFWNMFQLSATVLAIVLILIGWHLTSLTTTEYLYPLPTHSIIRYGVVETAEGDAFTTHISTWVPPPEELTINKVALLVVKCLFIDNATQGIYNITIRYLEFSPVDRVYIPAEKNYTERFLSLGMGDGCIFSGFVSVPSAVGLTESQQPIPKDIMITVLTNVTAPITSTPFRVESQKHGNLFMEKQPYRAEAFLCIGAGVTILAGTLITSISIQIYENKRQK